MIMEKHYSEDPIIVKEKSNVANTKGIRMPRVVCVVTCGDKTEKLSCTVSADTDTDKTRSTARFNLSDTLNGILMQRESYGKHDDGAPMLPAGFYGMMFSYHFLDVYYNDGEQTGEPFGKVDNEFLVPGRSSDYRRLGHGPALPFLSLKQNFFGEEHVLRGFPYLISQEKERVKDEDPYDVRRFRTIDSLPKGSRNLCVIDYNPMMHHPIIFRNSFGELETCLAWCRQKINVKVQQEVYVTSRAAYDGQRTQIVSAYGDEMQIALTSGYVTPMWAQWWTFEPLRSRRAWIWMPTDLTTAAGTWVPCILKQDNNTILDRSKGASEINFTAVLDWQGGLL